MLQDLDNVALAVAMLFGLMYALIFSYPADLRYTFEVTLVQKIFMELDGGKLSNKALALKNRLFSETVRVTALSAINHKTLELSSKASLVLLYYLDWFFIYLVNPLL